MGIYRDLKVVLYEYMEKEMKVLISIVGGFLLGWVLGSLLLGIILGTIFGLVWGYSDHMLQAPHTHRKASTKVVKKAKKRSRK